MIFDTWRWKIVENCWKIHSMSNDDGSALDSLWIRFSFHDFNFNDKFQNHENSFQQTKKNTEKTKNQIRVIESRSKTRCHAHRPKITALMNSLWIVIMNSMHSQQSRNTSMPPTMNDHKNIYKDIYTYIFWISYIYI